MEFEFLKHFWRRMKSAGMYTVLVQNSFQKTTWKQYGFTSADQQVNVIFSVLLYIMEQSLKDEPCTMDDIGAYIDSLNSQYFQKPLTYDGCKALGEFIVNVILCNEGRAMYFKGYDFEQKAYRNMNISFVANRIIYVNSDVRRTSYYLTDDGYNLILGTLEIENNMKLTIHEMIFQLHLEKASYDKALDEIKNIFNLLRIQLQKIEEAMNRIRRNALSYSVADYKEILEGNLETISDTKNKFQNYRQVVKERVKELEEQSINVRKLKKGEEEALDNLRVIGEYLNRAIDEHQKILNSHFDLKALYTKELEQLSQLSLIRRFPLRTELYEKVLGHAEYLAGVDDFLRPLFNRDLDKIYNLNKALQLQRPIRGKGKEEEESILTFDEEEWQAEQERLWQLKLKRYEDSLEAILTEAAARGEITLMDLKELAEAGDDSSREPAAGDDVPDHGIRDRLLPNVDIFKEIMVELLKNQSVDIDALKKERGETVGGLSGGFQLNETILNVLERAPALFGNIKRVEALRLEDEGSVIFENIPDGDGRPRRIRCSNCIVRLIRDESAKTGANEELENSEPSENRED